MSSQIELLFRTVPINNKVIRVHQFVSPKSFTNPSRIEIRIGEAEADGLNGHTGRESALFEFEEDLGGGKIFCITLTVSVRHVGMFTTFLVF